MVVLVEMKEVIMEVGLNIQTGEEEGNRKYWMVQNVKNVESEVY